MKGVSANRAAVGPWVLLFGSRTRSHLYKAQNPVSRDQVTNGMVERFDGRVASAVLGINGAFMPIWRPDAGEM